MALPPNLHVQKGAILLNKREVQAREWLNYLIDNWHELTLNMRNFTILLLAGRHGKYDGSIGPLEDTDILMFNHERLIAVLHDQFAKDIDDRNIRLELLNVNQFYDESNQLDIKLLSFSVKAIEPSLVVISICFSEKLDLRFALELEGVFPSLRLARNLSLVTQGKQIHLDPVQTNLLYTMSESDNIEKTTILHGPEGSGKTILAVEVMKMKVLHYIKKHSLKIEEARDKIKLIVCGSYTGEDRVPDLLKQLREETKDIQDFCTVEMMPIGNVPFYFVSWKCFTLELEQFVKIKSHLYLHLSTSFEHL